MRTTLEAMNELAGTATVSAVVPLAKRVRPGANIAAEHRRT